ncbi:MAG: hydroxymethylbilane synthase, partial [Armatimonadetes bacterium]|nr:hydroxymethylbilane synthase [Anaerolineae bacterium]
QLHAIRPDLRIHDLRGNIDTRISQALAVDGKYDAILLAHAGVERLGRIDVVSATLALEVMLPAPAQAAISLQVRDNAAWSTLLESVNDHNTQLAVSAERAFLRGLGGGCALPIAAYAEVMNDGNALHLRGRILSLDGQQQVDVTLIHPLATRSASEAEAAGSALAQQALAAGAYRLMEVNP